jgi:hypothetical protein
MFNCITFTSLIYSTGEGASLEGEGADGGAHEVLHEVHGLLGIHVDAGLLDLGAVLLHGRH